MQHPLRLTSGLTALALAVACADSPVAPRASLAPLSAARQGSTAAAEYDWTFNNKVFAVLFGEHMLPENRTDVTTIVPGDVKWVEWEFTARRGPDAAGLIKDAKALRDVGLIKACTDVFPLLICGWGDNLAPKTLDGDDDFITIVDLLNYEICGVELPFVDTATLTELGPYPAGAKPQVRRSVATLRVNTGVCPPKPRDVGCTLTQGYWKNHTWPMHPLFPTQPLDQWAAENDWTFFDSGRDWKDILGVAPRGDAYYILAHQYIAAILNAYNGAYLPPEVQQTIGKAYLWFADASVRATTSRDTVIGWASLLDDYNKGKLGVSHCRDGKQKGKKS